METEETGRMCSRERTAHHALSSQGPKFSGGFGGAVRAKGNELARDWGGGASCVCVCVNLLAAAVCQAERRRGGYRCHERLREKREGVERERDKDA